MKTFALLAPLLLLGCVDSGDDAAPADDTGGEIHPDFSSVGLHTYECASSKGYCTVDLGTSVDRTCFLAGLKGELQTWSTVGRGASVDIDTDGRYSVTILGTVASPTFAAVTCVNSAKNRNLIGWESGMPASYVPGTNSAARRCFLNTIVGEDTTSFTHLADEIGVQPDATGKWYVGGYITPDDDSLVYADAVCIDVTPDGAWAYTNYVTGSVFGDLAADNNDAACGLSSIRGLFDDGDLGVWITHTGGTYPQWEWSLDSWIGAAAYCVK